MRKTVFLHIGEPKAGSSYLQAQMWANRSFLRRHGIHLPGRGPVDHYQAGSDLQEEPVRDRGARRPEAWNWLVDRIEETDAETSIISDERLARAKAEQVARAMESLDAFDVRLIFAVREFAGLVASEWQQIVKMGGTAPLDEWLGRLRAGKSPRFWQTHDVSDVLRRWDVPRDHVHLLVVPAAGAERHELWRRFASIVGAPATLPQWASRSNASLGLDETELVRRVYQHLEASPAPLPIQMLMRGVVSRQILAARDRPRPILLPEACRPWMVKRADRRTTQIAESGGQVVGELDELELDGSRFVAEPERPETTRVLDAALDVIGSLSGRIVQRRRRAGRPADGGTAGNGRTITFLESVRAMWPARRRRRAEDSSGPRRSYYLLVGPPGAGADILRRLLWANRPSLMSEGVYVAGSAQIELDGDGPDALRSSPMAASRPRRLDRAYRAVLRDAERSGHGKIVVADELLAGGGDDAVATFLRRLDGAGIHLLYVVRDLTTLLPTLWHEQVHSGTTPPWHEWLNQLIDDAASMPWWRAHELDRVLARWRQHGVENVHLLVYPRSFDAGATLWERLGSVVGWRTSSSTSIGESNRSGCCGHTQAELLRRMRPRLGPGQVVEVTRVQVALTPSDGAAFPEAARSWIELNSEHRRRCTTDPRNHVVGDPQDLAPLASAFTATQLPNEAAVLDAAVQVTAGLLEELASLKLRRAAHHRERLVAGLRHLR